MTDIRIAATIVRCETDFQNGNYVITYQAGGTDGVANRVLGQNKILVSFALTPKRANDAIRATIAQDARDTFGWTIDPDDIYFPMSSAS